VGKKLDKPMIASVTLVVKPHKKATSETNVRYVIDIVKYGKVKSRPEGFVPMTVTAEYLAQNNNRVVIEGLSPNTSYKFSITAVNASGDSSDGKKKPKDVAVNITAKTAKYAKVQKLKAPKAGITAESVALTWIASKAPLPEGAEVRYEILW
jgi:hypothetical protein